MSYCRISDESDVYVGRSTESPELPFVIQERGGPARRFGSRDEAAAYLLGLRAIGVRVPQRALDRINGER